jgi:hypothetical protein
MEMEFSGVGLNVACDALRDEFERLLGKKDAIPLSTIKRQYFAACKMFKETPEAAIGAESKLAQMREQLKGKYGGLGEGLAILGFKAEDFADL